MAIEPGPQFDENYVLLHRGIRGGHHRDVLDSGRGLGTHWSSDEDIARGFAEPGSGGTRRSDDEDAPEEVKGTRISAFVHKDNVMSPDEVKAWNERHLKNNSFQAHGIHTNEDGKRVEAEVPVRPGSPVHVVKATDLTFIPGSGYSGWFEDAEKDTELESPEERKA